MADKLLKHLPSRGDVQSALVRALDRMKQEDAHLFRVGVNERTLTQRLAHYLQNEFPEWNVDCEYNRYGLGVKRLPLVKRIRKDVYPDVILHKRGLKGPHLLVVEAKKSSDLNEENKAHDYYKLRLYKSGDSGEGER